MLNFILGYVLGLTVAFVISYYVILDFQKRNLL
jgi:hypothetical protein